MISRIDGEGAPPGYYPEVLKSDSDSRINRAMIPFDLFFYRATGIKKERLIALLLIRSFTGLREGALNMPRLIPW